MKTRSRDTGEGGQGSLNPPQQGADGGIPDLPRRKRTAGATNTAGPSVPIIQMTAEELQAMMDETAAKAAAWAASDAVAQYISAQGHSDFEEPILSESDPTDPVHIHVTPPIVELHDSEERVSLSDRSLSSERAPRRYAQPQLHQHSSASDQAP
ncbi:hypothetical protein ABFS83_03G027600 [Erythranthe nasuta]